MTRYKWSAYSAKNDLSRTTSGESDPIGTPPDPAGSRGTTTKIHPPLRRFWSTPGGGPSFHCVGVKMSVGVSEAAFTGRPDKASLGRRGSKFSDKQFAHAVKDGQAVTVVAHSGEVLASGFIYGMDDYHLGVVDERGNTMLVHKSAAVIRFEGVLPLDSLAGDVADKVKEICRPFRERVMREHFSQSPSIQ